ncbi:hypothetical protein [Rosistilla oblonga]|uniref:hypothetical protein n=1 Tax=Rosistilla oblonga TaxID=2527990 RepID=UPI003A977037
MNDLGRLIDLMFSPAGLLGMTATGVVAAVAIRRRWLLPYLVVIPLFASCFGKYRFITSPYAFPLEQILTLSRPIFVASAAFIAASCLLLLPQTASRKPHRASFFLFAFQIIYALRLIIEGDTEFGFLALATFSLSFIAIYSLRGALPSNKEAASATFCYAATATGALFAIACVYQFLVNPSASQWAGRFIGITNNSIHTGEFSGWFLISTLAVVLSAFGRRLYIIGYAMLPLIFLHLSIIIATGSRTALLLTTSGVLVLFRNRLGAFVIPLLLTPIALGFLNEYISDFDTATSRITSGTDSRSRVFLALWQRFVENPILGEAEVLGSGRIRVRESSYLTAAANLGLLGLIPLILCVFAYARSACQAIRQEKFIRKQIVFSDWAQAIMVSAFTAALFEGFLFAIVAPAAMLMHIGFSLVDGPLNTPSRQEIHFEYPPDQGPAGNVSTQR